MAQPELWNGQLRIMCIDSCKSIDEFIDHVPETPIAPTPHGRPYGRKTVNDRLHMHIRNTTSRSSNVCLFDVLSLSYPIGCGKESDIANSSNDNAHYAFLPRLVSFAFHLLIGLPVASTDTSQSLTCLRICRQVIMQIRAGSTLLIQVINDPFSIDCSSLGFQLTERYIGARFRSLKSSSPWQPCSTRTMKTL